MFGYAGNRDSAVIAKLGLENAAVPPCRTRTTAFSPLQRINTAALAIIIIPIMRRSRTRFLASKIFMGLLNFNSNVPHWAANCSWTLLFESRL